MAAKCQCICIDSRRRKHMKKTKETKTKDDHILSREDRIRESQEFNLLSDVFLSVALDDAPASISSEKSPLLRRTGRQ